MAAFELLHPAATMDVLGYLPDMFSDEDPTPVKEQIDRNYANGGGWRHAPGWSFDHETQVIKFPGDPPLLPLARCKVRDETVLLYQYSWVVVVQPDGTFEICHMD